MSAATRYTTAHEVNSVLAVMAESVASPMDAEDVVRGALAHFDAQAETSWAGIEAGVSKHLGRWLDPGDVRAIVEDYRNGAIPLNGDGATELGSPGAPAKGGRDASRPEPSFPAPLGLADLLDVEEPEEPEYVEELIFADSNVIVAAAPKSHKTNYVLHLGVAAGAGRAVLGAFPVPAPLRTGLVLMEDRPHRVLRRVLRMAASEGIDPAELEGMLHLWFRPPLRFNDPDVVRELGDYVEALELDMLVIDSWAYVATGNSNDSDEVTPQLMALSSLRDRRPGLTVVLVVHAGKHQENRGDRVTDIIRGSGAFGAWYDTGILLTRKDETAPVTMRVEHRDLPSPEPFAFTVEDEHPGSPPSGYLRLRRSEKSAEQLLREKNGAKYAPALLAELRKHHPGVSRRELRGLLDAPRKDVEAAFEVLKAEGKASYTPPAGKGRSAVYSATVPGVP